MPIRFACPHCHQKLTVSTRKAGSAADCPRCKQPITVPEPPPPPAIAPRQAVTIGPAATTDRDDAPLAPLPPGNISAATHEPADGPAFARSGEHRDEPSFPRDVSKPGIAISDSGGFEGLELVYDTTAEQPDPNARAIERDVVAVPRYVVYLQGGLLAIVALAAFALGMLAGGTMRNPAAKPAPQPSVIRGSVAYASPQGRQPDEGAVVVVIPKDSPGPDEKASIHGLRPGEPTPDNSHHGLAVLQQLGGGYARTDADGRFTIRVPDAGQYLVLVLSRERRSGSAEEIRTADVLKLGPYFQNASDLVAQHRYQLTTESVRGERELDVVFR